MSNRKCLGCECWEPEPGCMHGKFYGHCGSSIADGYVFGTLRTTCNFGCDFWEKQEPSLRKQLTERIENLVIYPQRTGSVKEEVDEIMTLFESYQKKP